MAEDTFDNDDAVRELGAVLATEVGKFGNYQAIPQAALRHCPALGDLDYDQSNQLPVDEIRHDWLAAHITLDGLDVVEIGANMGALSLTLAIEHGCRTLAFEPGAAFSRASALLATICGVQNQMTCIEKAVVLDDLSDLSPADVVVHLNVLHHAGAVYDQDRVTALGGWDAYAVDYLSRLRAVAPVLFFQTGNTSGGTRLFAGEDALDHVAALLAAAGWDVENIGIIEDFTNLAYQTYTPASLAKAPRFRCQRSPGSDMVEYFEHDRLVASLKTGMAQRPLWLCRRQEG